MQTTDTAASPTLAEGASFARYACGCASIDKAVAWPARRRPGTIEVLTVSGMITPRSWALLGQATGHIERCDGSIAAVSMMDFVYIPSLISAEEMCEADMRQVRASGQLRNPRAFIVAPSNVPLFRSYARLMAFDGAYREVFTGAEMPQALRWAQEQGLGLIAERLWVAQRAAARMAAPAADPAGPASSCT